MIYSAGCKPSMMNVEKKSVKLRKKNSGSCQNDLMQDNVWNEEMKTISWVLKIQSGILAVVLLPSGGMVSPKMWHCILTYKV